MPRAESFDDTYFSKAGGLAETQHVFLAGNGLPERFQGRDSFTIAEFGFGTGLNFLATLLAARAMAAAPKLTFVSFELYPMSADQLAKALAAFPEMSDVADELGAVWAPVEGWTRISLPGADLLLGVGDARQLIRDLQTGNSDCIDGGQAIEPIDAWYLDGFSPAKNPELWDLDLMTAAANLTAADGTLATYTSAGWVRRNLQEAGFSVRKVKGFAGKREMVVGQKTAIERPS
ncbi:MAG: tRNA (5-methylaminomethyl-2-thiouridine)(34)-methyltransferase MnmD [Roseibium sp.]